MKTTFPLQAPGKDDARVRDKIRHEVNKEVRRLRKKELPEGFQQWDLDCKIGPNAAMAEAKPVKELAAVIETLGLASAPAVFIEITAAPGYRTFTRPRPDTSTASDGAADNADASDPEKDAG